MDPRRIDPATRITLALLSRLFNWRDALIVVQPKTDAISKLKAIIDDIDPLYRPARFLLGHAHLTRGDATAAVQVFESLMEEFKVTARHSIYKLQTEWPRRLPRMIRLAKRIPGIRLWVKRWAKETTDVMGGSFYQAAVTWAEIKETLLDQSELGIEIRDFSLDTSLATFRHPRCREFHSPDGSGETMEAFTQVGGKFDDTPFRNSCSRVCGPGFAHP